MLMKNFRNKVNKKVNENVYYSDNKDIKTEHIKYCTVLIHTDKKENTLDLKQFLNTDTLYYCIFLMFKVIKR